MEDRASAPSAPQKPSFEQTHQDDLSVKKFAGEQALYFAVPAAATAVSAAAGWYGLAGVVSKLFPSLSKKVSTAEGFAAELRDRIGSKGFEGLHERMNDPSIKAKLEAAMQSGKGLPDIAKDVLQIEEKLVKVPKMARIASAVGLGYAGLMAGSLFIAYREWKKKASTELAAREINRDIANLQIFKPTNQELVSENVRLREMLAQYDKPAANDNGTAKNDAPAAVAHDAKLEASPVIDASSAQPDGKLIDTKRQLG